MNGLLFTQLFPTIVLIDTISFHVLPTLLGFHIRLYQIDKNLCALLDGRVLTHCLQWLLGLVNMLLLPRALMSTQIRSRQSPPSSGLPLSRTHQSTTGFALTYATYMLTRPATATHSFGGCRWQHFGGQKFMENTL